MLRKAARLKTKIGLSFPRYMNMKFIILALCVHLSQSYVPRFHHGRPRGGMMGVPEVDQLTAPPPPPEMWFVQQLDHFNDANTQTWEQRYYMYDKHYKPGGPVFLMLGGEGPASPFWMLGGAWTEYAKVYNAMTFQIEHRFYGKSHPTPDASDESLEFLNSEQALADAANFVEFAMEKYNVSQNKWIVFGGSYSGALSAWMRMKYPHLIYGSVASSAPVFAQLNFKNYLGVVHDSLATTGPGCNAAIQQATNEIQALIETQQGRDQLKKLFILCDDIDINNENDVSNLFETFTNSWAEVVQYNKEGSSNNTIDVLCEMMADPKYTVLERYARVNNKMNAGKCTDFVYSKMVNELRKTDWNSSAGVGGRLWTYQTCTEFGYYQTSDLATQPFGHNFPLSFSVLQCMDIFGSKFNESLISRGIKRTNTNYGGRGIEVTRIVFPNGSIDPWHALGILHNLGPDATAIYINGTAHCANMMTPTAKDPQPLVDARAQIQKLIGQWIQ